VTAVTDQAYPKEITSDVLEKLANISDDVIAEDIRDTQAELHRLSRELEGHRLIAEANLGSPAGRMAHFMISGKEREVAKREAFVAFLESVQQARSQSAKDEATQ
jgi:hypothetical protein